MATTLSHNYMDAGSYLKVGPAITCVRAGDATVLNSSGELEVVAANALRFDHTVAGAIRGLLVEEDNTELCLHNRDFTQTEWVKSNMTAAKDETGLDAVANACSSLTATAGNATALQSFTIASASKFVAFDIKRITGTGNVDITADNGASWQTVSINGSTFTRVYVIQTVTDPVIGIRLVTSGDAVAVDFATLIDGVASPRSRIETAGSTVLREFDDLRITKASYYSDGAPGTLYTRGVLEVVVLGTEEFMFSTNASNANGWAHYKDNAQLGRAAAEYRGGTAGSCIRNSVFADGISTAIASSVDTNDMQGYWTGQSGIADATVSLFSNAATESAIGSEFPAAGGSAASAFNGHLEEIRYLNERVEDSVLLAMVDSQIFPVDGGTDSEHLLGHVRSHIR